MAYRVVLVEDDPMVLSINRRYLEKDSRFEVCAAFRDGRSALEYLENNEADLLLLDIYMPVFTGLDLLKALRMRGIMDYLMKPFEYTRLKKALDMFVYQAVVRKRLEKGPKMHQQDIDKVFLDSPAGETVQKGIQEKTLQMIRAYVAQIGDRPLSSEEVAEQNGLSVVTAR